MGITCRWRAGIVLVLLAGLGACSGCATPARAPAGADAPAALAIPPSERSIAHAPPHAAPHTPVTSLPIPVAPRATGRGSARLSWNEPARLDYGPDAAKDPVVGYRIYVGPRPDALQLEAQVPDPRATGFVVRQLPKGTFWYTVTAYTRLGIESERPPAIPKTIR